MSKIKVFITQFARNLDFTQLNEYGEVRFLTRNEYLPEPCPKDVNKTVTVEITTNMKDYIPGVDFIVTTGSAIPNMLTAIEMQKRPGKHQILKWSNRDRKYEMYLMYL